MTTSWPALSRHEPFTRFPCTLASLLVALNLLAFAMHNACDLVEGSWQEGRRKVGAKMRLFEHIRTVTTYFVFPSWGSLLRTIRTGRPPPQPP